MEPFDGRTGWDVKRLNGMDAMLLYSETPNLHTHTLKVAVIDATDFNGEFTFEVFRQTVQRRLHMLDPLRYRLVDIPAKMHHPMWMENCDVDLDYHLRRVKVPAPGGRRELDEIIGDIASTPLERDRPLWEFHFAEGMADDRFALIGKVHHTLADGVASANLLARLMDLAGSARDERDDYTTCDPPSRGELLRTAGRDHVQNVAALPGLIRDAVGGFARVRRRSSEHGDQPDMAKMFKAPPTALPLTADGIFIESALPTDGRIHTVDVRDVGAAFAAATTADVAGEILLIAGDDSHKLLQKDVGSALAAALGLPGVLPEGRPGDPNDDDGWFLTDWMDTERAQEALAFQHHSWPDMLAEMSAWMGWKRRLLRLVAPVARVFLARRAAYRGAPGRYADLWGAVAARLGDPCLDRQPTEG
jgi:Wax ester synthase-like Acyl-CoA acyltransferase domain